MIYDMGVGAGKGGMISTEQLLVFFMHFIDCINA
jgi:hypothetical protein